MESNTDLSFSELYALERAARLARAKEVARLIRVGVRALVRFAGRLTETPGNPKGASHA